MKVNAHIGNACIVKLCIVLTAKYCNRLVDILLQSQFCIHLIKENDLSFSALPIGSSEALGYSGKMVW